VRRSVQLDSRQPFTTEVLMRLIGLAVVLPLDVIETVTGGIGRSA
jgi:hypothetical protein